MSYIGWNIDKNQKLKASRDVSFEDVVAELLAGRVLDDRKHPNVERYPHQRVYLVQIRDYVYLVPYVVRDEFIFLKTIIPSRKATREFMGGVK